MLSNEPLIHKLFFGNNVKINRFLQYFSNFSKISHTCVFRNMFWYIVVLGNIITFPYDISWNKFFHPRKIGRLYNIYIKSVREEKNQGKNSHLLVLHIRNILWFISCNFSNQPEKFASMKLLRATILVGCTHFKQMFFSFYQDCRL